MKNIKRFVYLFIFLVIFGCAIFYVNFGTPWSMFRHKNLFETYLEDTYKKDFVISDISYDMMHNNYHAHAYDIDNPELIFYVGEDNNSNDIDDGYEFEFTLDKAKTDVKNILKENMIEYRKLNVELINLSNKELEIIVWTNEDIDSTTNNLIKAEIEEIGYITEQLYFQVS
ncbi:YfjL-like protein [Ornithinibacillus contaminans]|uniref:YfjL-like protein n=1 Tax=Ornithinibacillus contaminans TaxID=694055 RepID=UPI00064DC03B|nr:hypothetical protein [Ornithinibacillus contaminans]